MRGIRRLLGNRLMLMGVLLGVVTAATAFVWLRAQQQDPAATVAPFTGALRDVVVARSDIPAGTILTTAMLDVHQLPLSALVTGSVADPAQLAGRTVRYPIAAGEQVLESRLVDQTQRSGDGLAFAVPPGMRAVSVPISEVSGAGGLIVPGDRVDVLVSTDYEALFGPLDPIASSASAAAADVAHHAAVLTVLQDVLVLAVGQETAPPADQQQDPATLRPQDAKAQPKASSVTLAVSPAQAQSLFMSSQHGTLGLALRSYGDKARSALSPLLRLQPVEGGSGTVGSAAAASAGP